MGSIKGILLGKNTDGFQRSVSRGANSNNCFSIITEEKTLNVECADKNVRDLWVRGLKFVVKNNRQKVEFFRRMLTANPGETAAAGSTTTTGTVVSGKSVPIGAAATGTNGPSTNGSKVVPTGEGVPVDHLDGTKAPPPPPPPIQTKATGPAPLVSSDGSLRAGKLHAGAKKMEQEYKDAARKRQELEQKLVSGVDGVETCKMQKLMTSAEGKGAN